MLKSLILLAALVAAPALAQDAPVKPAAKPTDCLLTRSITQAEAATDKHWYARTRNGKWYRNNMECPSLARGRALIHSSPIGSQCRGDIVQVVDFTMSGISFARSS